MARFEIVAHVTRELNCETAEEAAALFRRQLLAEARLADALVHLAVWRQETEDDTSPLPPSLRDDLVGFFTSIERRAAEEEAAFRWRVEAILLASNDAAPDES